MMNDVLLHIGNVMILLGAFFVFSGALGIVRFPDFFTRLHAAGVCDSLGLPLVLLGLACHADSGLVAAKLVLLTIFILFVSPTACHALAKAAFLADKTKESELSTLTARDVPKVDKSDIQEHKS